MLANRAECANGSDDAERGTVSLVVSVVMAVRLGFIGSLFCQPFDILSRFTGGPDPDVQHFDNGGERHRKINVTSFDVLADSVGDKNNAD